MGPSNKPLHPTRNFAAQGRDLKKDTPGDENHGDRKSPRPGVGLTSSKWPNFMVYLMGVILTTH